MGPRRPLRTLTAYEKDAISAATNLSDGHSHQPPSPAEQQLLLDLPEIFLTAAQLPQAAVEREFLMSFFELATGRQVGDRGANTLICYSASMACEIVANHLRMSMCPSVSLLEPTFDNIPSILRRHGLELRPIAEDQLLSDTALLSVPTGSALFLVCPNNPTGFTFPEDWWMKASLAAAERSITLIVDCAFRLFDPRMIWDQYGVLDKAGVDYILIEDMGKAWPTLDLKVGLLSASQSLVSPISRIHDDFLLNVSPFTLALLTEFIQITSAESPQTRIMELAASNRDILSDVLSGSQVELLDLLPTMGVSWLRLPKNGPRASEICRRLEERDVHLLPGAPFFWHSPARGEYNLRIALMRSPSTVRCGVESLREVVKES